MVKSLEAMIDGTCRAIKCVPDLNAQIANLAVFRFLSTGGFDVSWQNTLRSTHGFSAMEDISPNC